MKFALPVVALLLLSACSTTPSRYQHRHDFTPQPIDVQNLQEPTPRAEPRSVMGNPASYTVLGKKYYLLPTAAGYKERGGASWYGMKFHGHTTSNGEIYDVYKFTAAHKSLPIPSYVRVTNLGNGKSVVVRVNDRGPFHEGRIIDLSYAAAVKIDMHKQGVAQVEVEVIEPAADHSVRWIQVGALSNHDAAVNLQRQVQNQLQQMQWPVTIKRSNNLSRVRIGPVPEGAAVNAVLEQIKPLQLGQPLLLAEHQL